MVRMIRFGKNIIIVAVFALAIVYLTEVSRAEQSKTKDIPFFPGTAVSRAILEKAPGVIKLVWEQTKDSAKIALGVGAEIDDLNIKLSETCAWMPRYIPDDGGRVEYGLVSMYASIYVQALWVYYIYFDEPKSSNTNYLDIILNGINPAIALESVKCTRSRAGKSSKVESALPNFESLGFVIPSKAKLFSILAMISAKPENRRFLSELGSGAVRLVFAHELSHHILHKKQKCCSLEQEIEADKLALKILHHDGRLATTSLGHLLLLSKNHSNSGTGVSCRIRKILDAEIELVANYRGFGNDALIVSRTRSIHEYLSRKFRADCPAG